MKKNDFGFCLWICVFSILVLVLFIACDQKINPSEKIRELDITNQSTDSALAVHEGNDNVLFVTSELTREKVKVLWKEGNSEVIGLNTYKRGNTMVTAYATIGGVEYSTNVSLSISKKVGIKFSNVLNSETFDPELAKCYIVDTPSYKVFLEFDSKARILRRTTYCQDPEITETTTYEYNALDQLERTITKETGKPESSSYVTYKYDADGNRKELYHFINGVQSSHESYEYDADGNRIKATLTWADLRSTVREFDSNGNQTKQVDFYKNGKPQTITEFVNGKESNSIRYDENGVVYSREESEYDSDGNLKKTYFDKNGKKTSTVEYDLNVFPIIETMFDENGDIEYYRRFEYDAEGNLEKTTNYDKDGHEISL